MESRFCREELLIKKEGLEKLLSSRILVVGLGGVGSYVVEALARTGVGYMGICDYDTVSISNINRQLIALESTIGLKKIDVVESRLKDINPLIKIKKYPYLLNDDSIDSFNLSSYDYIVDAIDMISSKVLLIKKAKELNIPIISCMGTGNKLNPQDLFITDLVKSHTCPLAKKMRYELKKYDIRHVKILMSKEMPLSNDSNMIGSISFVPSVAGLFIAGEVVKDLLLKEKL